MTEQNNTKQYFAELYNRVEIEAHVNVYAYHSGANTLVAPFKGEIGLVICKDSKEISSKELMLVDLLIGLEIKQSMRLDWNRN